MILNRFFGGKDGRGRQTEHPESYDLAALLDGQHFAKTGEQMPLNALASELKRLLRLQRQPSRATLRQWRSEDDYHSFATAIATEVAATLSLRASQSHWAWLVVVVAGYVSAYLLLTVVLRAGMPIGVAYGIWGATGTAGAAVLAAAIFDEPFTWPIVGGIVLIIAGILLVELGSRRAKESVP